VFTKCWNLVCGSVASTQLPCSRYAHAAFSSFATSA
jgi:hypothetical protein